MGDKDVQGLTALCDKYLFLEAVFFVCGSIIICSLPFYLLCSFVIAWRMRWGQGRGAHWLLYYVSGV